MPIHYMSEEELAITKIKGIKSIHLYDLVLGGYRGDDSVIFGIIVSYGQSDYLNYCEMDSLFSFYKQKLFAQYQLEKKKRNIQMDEATKIFMEAGKFKTIPIHIKEYVSSRPYEIPLINYGIRKFKRFESILRYHLSALLKYLSKDFEMGELTGINENLFIKDKNNQQHGLPITILNISDNEVLLQVGGVFDRLNCLTIKINFDANRIKFSLSSADGIIAMYTEYVVADARIYEEMSLHSNGKCIYYNKQYNDQKANPDDQAKIKNLLSLDDRNIKISDIYTLPWGAYFMGYEQLLDKESTGYQLCTRRNAYVDFNDDYIGLILSEETSVNNSVHHNLRINGSQKRMDIYRLMGSNTAIAQVHFSNIPYSNGIYKEKLSDKYFYGIVESDNFMTLENAKLYRVDNSHEIEAEYQLFELEKIEKIRTRGTK